MNPVLVRAVSVGRRVVEQAVKRLSSDPGTARKSLHRDRPRYLQKAATGCDPGPGSPRSIIHADGWRGYNGLVDIGCKKHFRVHHGENKFARGNFHINGIESFWSYAKRRLAKFNGFSRQTFLLHLKECEFRFNHREEISLIEYLLY